MKRDEIIGIITVIFAIIIIYIAIETQKFAHFIGADFWVTLWAILTTLVVIFVVVIVKLYSDFKNKTIISGSLAIIWFKWREVLVNIARKESGIDNLYNNNIINWHGNSAMLSLPWWSNIWFFGATETILVLLFIYFVIKDLNLL